MPAYLLSEGSCQLRPPRLQAAETRTVEAVKLKKIKSISM